MTFAPKYPDGYHDENGVWHRTKLCFVDCGDRCTCREPMKMHIDKEWLKNKIENTVEEEIEAGSTPEESFKRYVNED